MCCLPEIPPAAKLGQEKDKCRNARIRVTPERQRKRMKRKRKMGKREEEKKD